MFHVAVLGAGVNGLGCAVRIIEKYPSICVTLISKNFSPNTTGDGSAGFWFPFLCGETSQQNLYKWGKETYEFVHKLWTEGLSGVCLTPALVLNDEALVGSDPSWKSFVFGYTVMDKRYLDYLSDRLSANLKCGIYFTTFTAEPKSLLPYLMDRFTKAGGKVIEAEVPSLRCEMLEDYDLVVNCVGLGARTLANDQDVYPIRGQVARVNAPWMFEVIVDNASGNYIIPNVRRCVLGGTHQEHRYDTAVDAGDARFILRGCADMVRALQRVKVIEEWAGLRPGRSIVRLDHEIIDKRPVIHNYGHGGSGVTLFWGCAKNVVEILDHILKERNVCGKSKL